MRATPWWLAALCTAAAGCQSDDPKAASAPAPCAEPWTRAPLFQLPATVKPANLPTTKSAPYVYAVALPVNRPLEQLGRWSSAAPGWSSLALRVASIDATSLAIHLKPATLPPQAQLWLCSTEAVSRQGPLAGDAELFTPAVRGNQALIEVLVPDDARTQVQVTLVDVMGGFR